MGGVANGGAYAFKLLPTHASYGRDRVAYFDAEDPNRSSWCRFINHARRGENECNCTQHVYGLHRLIWIQTGREVAEGEELHFDYFQGEPPKARAARMLVYASLAVVEWVTKRTT